MNVLFDQATPVPIRQFLSQHTVRTAYQQGWSELKNGALLAAAESAGFDVFVTTDRNMNYQQNLTNRKLALVVLDQQQWPALRPHISLVVKAVNESRPRTFVEVAIPR